MQYKITYLFIKSQITLCLTIWKIFKSNQTIELNKPYGFGSYGVVWHSLSVFFNTPTWNCPYFPLPYMWISRNVHDIGWWRSSQSLHYWTKVPNSETIVTSSCCLGHLVLLQPLCLSNFSSLWGWTPTTNTLIF